MPRKDPLPISWPIVEVTWLDAVETTEWKERTDIQKPLLSKSVGYMVAKTEDYVTVMALANEHHLSMGVTIPSGMVKRIRTLTYR